MQHDGGEGHEAGCEGSCWKGSAGAGQGWGRAGVRGAHLLRQVLPGHRTAGHNGVPRRK